MKILVADDDAVERLVVCKTLELGRHEVMMAFGGQQAWEMIQHKQVRFLVTDWTMPGLDGLQLIRMIRSAPLPGYTYIILLTSRDQPGDIVSGLSAGADDYLTKPFNPLELQARVAVGERILRLEQNLIEARDQLQRQAMHDGLTGLLNRRALYDLAQVELERGRRHSSPFGLIFLDVDNLKHINDRYGHQFGDVTLKAVANVLRENSRPYDGVGRWAGDEFMVALPEAAASNAIKVTERILQGIHSLRLVTPNGENLSIGASAGVAVISQVSANSATLDALVKSADEALYRAKNSGRGQLKSNEL